MATVDYTPPPTCAAFMQSLTEYRFIIGPVGSGKTTAILMDILHKAKRQSPSPVDGKRKTRFCVIRNTNRMLEDTTLKSFFSWFPPGVAGQWQQTQRKFTFRFDDIECEVLFRPLDKPDDVSNVLSLELTGAVLDEFVEIPREIVDAIHSRCGRYPSSRDGGCTWFGIWGASNPGNEDSWWYDYLYEPWPDDPNGVQKRRKMSYFEQPSGFAPNAENLVNLPPYREGDNVYYKSLAEGKKKSWVKQFICVEWGFSLKGKPVYPIFKKELHVAESSLIYNPYLPLVIGFDAGLTPAAVLGQQTKRGRVQVLREIVTDNMGASRFCRLELIPLLNELCGGSLQAVEVYADPACRQRAQTNEATVVETLEEELDVLVSTPDTNSLAARIGSVDHFLSMLTDDGPAYVVDPSCKHLIRGFGSGYCYDINQKGVASVTPVKNSFSHVHDANQYMCMRFKNVVNASKNRKPLPRQHSNIYRCR